MSRLYDIFGVHRLVGTSTPRGRARCSCGKALDYDYGSLRWQCQEEDLCPACWAGRTVKKIFSEPSHD